MGTKRCNTDDTESGASASLSDGNPVPPGNVERPETQTGSDRAKGTAPYEALTNEKDIQVINLRDLQREAAKILPPYSSAYISGGAGDEWTMRQNEEAFNRWVIEPRYLSGIKEPDPTTTILGSRLSLPVITAPMGGQGIAHALKEIPNVIGTHASGTLYTNTSVSHLNMEEIAAASVGPKWYQIYFPENRDYARELLRRVVAAGYRAIVVTVDSTTFGNREQSMRLGIPRPDLGNGNGVMTPGIDPEEAARQKVDLNWDDIDFCGRETGLPVIIKGVLTPETAMEALKHGCAGIWVSNHGGRALDNTAPSVSVLPRIADAVAGKAVIILDGGIRRGQDVFRALALGADVTALGRPLLYGMALGGSRGVRAVYEKLRTELRMVMQLAGTKDIKSISRDFVREL